MTIVIEIYIIICVALLLFDVVFLRTKKHRTNALYPKNTKFENEIYDELKNYRANGTLTENFSDSLVKQLGNVRELITLVSVLEKNPEGRKVFAPYVFRLIDTYMKKNLSEQAYYAYVVSLFDYNQDDIPEDFCGKFMTFLDSRSLYTFVNAMNALYHFGQPNLLLQAMDKVNERDRFYHKKLLIDGLLSSSVDFSVFNPQLADRFSSYNSNTQSSLLDFFRMNNYDVKSLCMQLLKEPTTDEQVRYAAMRYFSKFPTDASRVYFLGILEDKSQSWVAQMLAIQGLLSYDDETVMEAVKAKLTSRDWYVRVNAAEFLFKHPISDDALYELLAMKDRYATEIMRYCCRNDKDMSKRIAEIAAKLEQQDQAAPVDQEPVKPALT